MEKENRKRYNFTLSDNAFYALTDYSEKLNMSKSGFLDMLLVFPESILDLLAKVEGKEKISA